MIGDELYIVSDVGVATCLDAASGEQHWQSRLGGGFSASPLAAEGRIYFTNEEGLTTVMEAGRTVKKLAENQVEAHPGIAGNLGSRPVLTNRPGGVSHSEQIALPHTAAVAAHAVTE